MVCHHSVKLLCSLLSAQVDLHENKERGRYIFLREVVKKMNNLADSYMNESKKLDGSN